jgi:hypothetical protein
MVMVTPHSPATMPLASSSAFGWGTLFHRGFIACSFLSMIGGIGALVFSLYLSSREVPT